MGVFEIRESEGYARWFRRLRDRQARARILARNNAVVILLAGGDKSTQPQDIMRAQALAYEV